MIALFASRLQIIFGPWAIQGHVDHVQKFSTIMAIIFGAAPQDRQRKTATVSLRYGIWFSCNLMWRPKGADPLPLPKPSIDTGMGLERLAAVLQGKHDNYDIDLMRALIEASAQASNDEPDGPNQVSHRMIADHLRSAAFLIADGVLPSNEGRGYVLRRIMRRGMRHAHLVGNTDPLMHKLVPAISARNGGSFWGITEQPRP